MNFHRGQEKQNNEQIIKIGTATGNENDIFIKKTAK